MKYIVYFKCNGSIDIGETVPFPKGHLERRKEEQVATKSINQYGNKIKQYEIWFHIIHAAKDWYEIFGYMDSSSPKPICLLSSSHILESSG